MKVHFRQPGTLDIQHTGSIDLSFEADEQQSLAAWEKQWEIRSFSEGGLSYYVSLDLSCPPGRQWACTCPAYKETKHPGCKHIAFVMEELKVGLLRLLLGRAISPHLVDCIAVRSRPNG